MGFKGYCSTPSFFVVMPMACISFLVAPLYSSLFQLACVHIHSFITGSTVIDSIGLIPLLESMYGNMPFSTGMYVLTMSKPCGM